MAATHGAQGGRRRASPPSTRVATTRSPRASSLRTGCLPRRGLELSRFPGGTGTWPVGPRDLRAQQHVLLLTALTHPGPPNAALRSRSHRGRGPAPALRLRGHGLYFLLLPPTVFASGVGDSFTRCQERPGASPAALLEPSEFSVKRWGFGEEIPTGPGGRQCRVAAGGSCDPPRWGRREEGGTSPGDTRRSGPQS